MTSPKASRSNTLTGVMSSVERRGAWTVPAHLEVRAFWGNVELDLREATLEPGLTTIEVNVRMANVEIIVPPHIRVDMRVDSFAANVSDRTLAVSRNHQPGHDHPYRRSSPARTNPPPPHASSAHPPHASSAHAPHAPSAHPPYDGSSAHPPHASSAHPPHAPSAHPSPTSLASSAPGSPHAPGARLIGMSFDDEPACTDIDDLPGPADAFAGTHATLPLDDGAPRLEIIGKVRFGNCEVITLARGERREDAEWRMRRHERRERHRLRRERRRRRWEHIRAEREMWRRARETDDPDQRWLPWWLMSRMRWRIFLFLAIALGVGIVIGVRIEHRPWWWLVLGAVLLSGLSGAIAWRLTRPLIMAIRAARDIGDGKLDTRLDPQRHGGEVRLLANAINDMASKIQQQLSDQRQLLAAVSHELRTPLGHMRVLIETARDRGDIAALQELEREVLVLDDLVGKLLASSRLEFGNLDRRSLDLGELVSDVVVTTTTIIPEAIEAIGDVRASVDPTLLRRAVANLIDNARVHGGGAVAVRIERRANQVAIEVDDAGPGVPPDRRADAFRAFVPSSGGGLGLGLALVSRIAVAHGGGAWIADRPGGGARIGFTVEATPA